MFGTFHEGQDENAKRHSDFDCNQLTMMMMMMKKLLPFLLLTSVAGGQPQSSVVVLTTSNFQDMLEDPANGLFLLKFYAPW